MPEKIRWGILSTAQISDRIIKAAKESTSCEIIAVSSRHKSTADSWARRHGIPRSFPSYEEMLKFRDIDAIYNPLPNNMHAEWTIKALNAGFPVLCEKPFTLNSKQAAEVAQVAEQTGLHVAEGFMYCRHPLYERVMSAIYEDRAIGELRAIHSQFTFMMDNDDDISGSAALGGGALYDVGCYCVHASRMICRSEPIKVFASEDRRNGVDLGMFGLLEFASGVRASFECGINSFERHRLEISGTEGSIIIDDPWIPGESATGFNIYSADHETEHVVIKGANTYQLELEEFAAVISGDRKPKLPIDDAVNNMKVLDALFASAREGKSVAV